MYIRKSNINTLMVIRVIGWLLMIEAMFMTVPMCVSLYYNEYGCAEKFFYTILITLSLGGLTTKFVRPDRMDMHRKEGFLLTSLI